MSVRVVIAEDAVLFRAGLTRLLEDHGHRVCAAAGDGDALLTAVAEFAGALERLAAGGTALDPEVVGQLLRASRHADGLTALTAREREVLTLMAEGRSNAGIADALVVTGGTVEKHVASIFDKLGLPPDEADNRRVLAVLRYLSS
jgi:DNA-binding NarL/FixJ family response regulator